MVARMQTMAAQRQESGLARLFARLLARPWWPALGLVLITALAAWQATQMRIAVNLSGLIGQQTEGAQAIRRYEERFAPLQAEEVLLIRAPGFGGSLASDDALTAFEDLVLDLQFVDGVAQVISLAALPAPGREGSWLSGPELADLPPRARLETMRAQNPLAAQLVSADLGAAVLAVVPDEGAAGDALAGRVMAATRGIDGLEATNVGLLAVQRAIAAELIHDITVLTPSAVALCLLLSLFLFRSLRAVAVIAVPPITGLVWFFGWLGASGTAVDPLMGSLPVVLIVLAFSDAIHVYHTAIHALEQGADRQAELARALAETAPAAALTSLTTVIAFTSLALPDSPSLNAMAWAGAVGMSLCLTSVLLLTPVLMHVLGVPRSGGQPPRLFSAVVPPARAVSRHPRAVVLAAVLSLAGVWALQSQSTVGFRYADYLPRGSDVAAALAAMDADGLGSDRMLVIVEADPAAPAVARASGGRRGLGLSKAPPGRLEKVARQCCPAWRHATARRMRCRCNCRSLRATCAPIWG